MSASLSMVSWLCWVSLAAAEKPQAEYQRLHEEMDKLAARTAWTGVDRVYAQMIELADNGGVKLTYADHMLGVSASQSLGNVNDTWTRLNAANAVEATPETFDMLAVIYANYGPVSLKVKKSWEGEPTLEAKDLAFQPEQQRVVQQAREALTESRAYDGLLPLGRYVLGSQAFDIVGGPLVKVTLRKEPKYVLPE